MNRKLLIGGILFVVIIGVIFAFGLRFNSSSRTVTKTLKDLLVSAGTSQKCSFNNDTTYSGNIYIGNNQVRADITKSGKTGHLLLNSSNATQWYDDNPNGLRLAFDEVSIIDLNAKFNFICQSWVLDANQFSLPAQNLYYPSKKIIENYGTTVEPSQCKVCEGLEPNALQTCKKQLNCP